MLKTIKKYYILFFFDLRLKQVFNYKVPFILSTSYLCILLLNISAPKSLMTLCLYLVSVFGTGGFGYLVNDYYDKANDYRLRKNNFVNRIGSPHLWRYFLLFIFLGWVPWIFLPHNKINLTLLFMLYLLFILYSRPPIRLKDKKILGILTDSLYAHFIPCIITIYTFCLIGNSLPFSIVSLFAPLLLWQFLLGIRNISLHQLMDLTHDREINAKTWGVHLGANKLKALLQYVIIPFEIISLIIFLIFFSDEIYLIIPGILIYWGFCLVRSRFLLKEPHAIDIKEFLNTYLDNYYYGLMPVLILFVLMIKDPQYISLFILHIVICPNNFLSILTRLKTPK